MHDLKTSELAHLPALILSKNWRLLKKLGSVPNYSYKLVYFNSSIYLLSYSERKTEGCEKAEAYFASLSSVLLGVKSYYYQKKYLGLISL